MKHYNSMNPAELRQEYEAVLASYEQWKDLGLRLNMARGKPGAEQLDTMEGLLTVLNSTQQCRVDGIDARNYGELSGLPCAKRFWAELLGCDAEQVFVGGNASLTLMYNVINIAWCHGLVNSKKPWCKLDKVKFLCPVPGYDRHFTITGSFGIEMIPVPMTDEGPDMEMVEELVKDPAVKGIWCVPKYSNPDGIIYSSNVVHRMAALHPAAKDFVVMWDNAYCVHEFDGEFVPFEDILTLCAEAGNPNMAIEFASTSKLTYPGAGISVLATSRESLKYLEKLLSVQMISADKLNQLRHVLYMKDKETTLQIAKRHGDILRPKFRTVLDMMERELAPRGLGWWRRPTGGYFVSYYGVEGTAKRILELCAQAGVVMTAAGATYPYGNDPMNSNIRIAPSLPPVKELEQAMEIFCLCVRLAALEKLL